MVPRELWREGASPVATQRGPGQAMQGAVAAGGCPAKRCVPSDQVPLGQAGRATDRVACNAGTGHPPLSGEGRLGLLLIYFLNQQGLQEQPTRMTAQVSPPGSPSRTNTTSYPRKALYSFRNISICIVGLDSQVAERETGWLYCSRGTDGKSMAYSGGRDPGRPALSPLPALNSESRPSTARRGSDV